MADKSKNVLEFKQDDKFYYQRAMRLIDNYEFTRGIKMLNMAIKQKPNNIEYRMSLCDILTDIGYYSKSIEEIINIMVIDSDFDSRCYYMLGYNYYELGDYIKALNMFERFLSIDPEGDLSDEVFFFLENIEQFTVTSWKDYSIFPSHIYSTKSDITNIDETRISEDIDVWGREQNIKALMAYSKKEYVESTKICENILSKLPRQSSVLCTLSLSLYKEGKIDESLKMAKSLSDNVQNNLEDLFRVSFVLCELKMDSSAKEVLQKLKLLMPYSEKINHYLAVAYYNCGDYENARKLWEVCYEINSESYKYQWYLNNLNNPHLKRLEYSDYLPAFAVLENIAYMEKLLHERDDNPELNCWDDDKFRNIVLGSLEKCTEEVQEKLLHIINENAGEEREAVFRKFLLSDFISEKNKNEILSFLHHIDAKEPFLMMAENQLVDVAINVISVDNNSKNDFVEVLNYAINNICADENEKEQVAAFWSSVAIKFMIDNRRIKNIKLWAAGFYWAAVIEMYTEEKLEELARLLGVSMKSLKRVLKMINEKKGEKE